MYLLLGCSIEFDLPAPLLYFFFFVQSPLTGATSVPLYLGKMPTRGTFAHTLGVFLCLIPEKISTFLCFFQTSRRV